MLPKLFPNDVIVTEDGQIEMPAPLIAAAATLVSPFHLSEGHKQNWILDSPCNNIQEVQVCFVFTLLFYQLDSWNLPHGYSGATVPVTIEEELVKGMNPAALPLTYDTTPLE